MKIWFVLFSMLSAASFATGFICTEDMRDVEGMFKEMQLVDTGNGHDLVFRSMTGNDPKVTEKKLATGLACTFGADPRISHCFKAGSAANESDSLLVSKRVEVTQIRAGEAGGRKQTYLYADVRSPSIENNKGEFRFMFKNCKAE